MFLSFSIKFCFSSIWFFYFKFLAAFALSFRIFFILRNHAVFCYPASLISLSSYFAEHEDRKN